MLDVTDFNINQLIAIFNPHFVPPQNSPKKLLFGLGKSRRIAKGQD